MTKEPPRPEARSAGHHPEEVRLAEQLRSLREAAGLTQKQLADRARISRSVIARVETGVNLPTIPTLRRIAEALGVEFLLGFQSPGESATPMAPLPVSSGPAINVFVADSQRLFAESLATALARFSDLKVHYLSPTKSPVTGLEAAEAIARVRPDVALVDFWMADMGGSALTRSILGWAPEVKVILLSWLHGPQHVQEALKAGALGFLPKSLGVSEIAEAVRRAHTGEQLVFGEELARLTETIGKRADQADEIWTRLSTLTPKEVDVLRVLSSGRPMNEVARALSIAPGTLRRHVENIMFKTGAASRMEAAAMARRAGLIEG